MSAGLTYTICDVWGTPVRTLSNRLDGSVEIGINEPRTASFSLSLYDDAAALISPLSTIVKVYWGDLTSPIFVGPVINPEFSGNDEKVTVHCIDGAFRLQKAFAGVPLAYVNQRVCDVLQSIVAYQITKVGLFVGAPPLGFSLGTLHYSGLSGEYITRTFDYGSNLWDTLLDLASSLAANDLVLTPLDQHDGYHWRFDTPLRMGTDLSASVQFHYNCLSHNTSDFTYSPDATDVGNFVTAVGQPSEVTDDLDTAPVLPYGQAVSTADLNAVGVYETWDSNEGDTPSIELARAQELAYAYHTPPPFFTVVPLDEGDPTTGPSYGKPPRFLIDYFVGDTVRAIARKGALNADLAGRIRKATLSDSDENPKGKVELEIAPNVSTPTLSTTSGP